MVVDVDVDVDVACGEIGLVIALTLDSEDHQGALPGIIRSWRRTSRLGTSPND